MSVCYSFVSVRDKKLKSVHIMGVTMDTTTWGGGYYYGHYGGTTMGTMVLQALWDHSH